MKAEQTKKLDAMMGVTPPPASGGKPKGKKKKKVPKAPSPEPTQPPPQDELPISLPSSTSGLGMMSIYPDRQLPQEEVNHSAMGEDKTESSNTEESMKASDGGDEGESESEEEESGEEEGKGEDTKKQQKEKKEAATDIISDTYNGASLDNYKWSQTMTDIDVRVPIAPGTRSKDVTVEIKNDHLKVVLHKPERKVNYVI